METDRITRALRWAGMALSLAQLAAPRTGRRPGDDRRGGAARNVRTVGVRGLMHAALLLGGRRPARWTWSRAAGPQAGSTLDLAAPGRATARRRAAGRRAASAGAAGITAADLLAAKRSFRTGTGAGVTIGTGFGGPEGVRTAPHAQPVEAGREGGLPDDRPGSTRPDGPSDSSGSRTTAVTKSS